MIYLILKTTFSFYTLIWFKLIVASSDANLNSENCYNYNLNKCLKEYKSLNKLRKLNITCNMFDHSINQNDQHKTQFSLNEVDYFFIKDQYNLEKIPDSLFANLRIDVLILQKIQINYLSSETFQGTQGLNKLIIKESSIESIDSNAFKSLVDFIYEIEISHSKLDDLKFLNFVNSINQLTNIQYLHITNNEFTRISSDLSLVKPSPLVVLNLSFNRINKIDSDAFGNLTNLARLNLKNNNLSGCLEQAPYSSLKNSLVRLSISHNRLTCLSEFELFENLQYLDLSFNLIETITNKTFQNLFNLYVLDLNYNRIKSLDPQAFSSLKNLYYLKLDSNNISQIPDLRHLTSLISLTIRNQSGHLTRLNDFQFQRFGDPLLSLTVNVDMNRFQTISKKAFCARKKNQSHVDKLFISDESLVLAVNTDKCLLAQLSSFNSINASVSVFSNNSTLSSSNKTLKSSEVICNCEFYNFIRSQNIIVFEFNCDFGQCVNSKIDIDSETTISKNIISEHNQCSFENNCKINSYDNFGGLTYRLSNSECKFLAFNFIFGLKLSLITIHIVFVYKLP